jgi:hypothetical protein
VSDPKKPSQDVLNERERVLRILEGRVRRLKKVLKGFPPGHLSSVRVSASIFNLEQVIRWVRSGRPADDIDGVDCP